MTRPLISIGLVVRNGEDHLPETIESLLNQTCGDFELVIYDNASTDRTPQIARDFTRRDRRVHLVRHSQNIGLVANFAAALDHASAPYFCWAACDDLREPAFLETLLGLLQQNPRAGLAGCEVRNLDPDGAAGDTRPETRDMHFGAEARPGRRLVRYLREAPCTLFYGLYRTEAAKEQIDVLRDLADPPRIVPLGGDMVFLAALLKRHGVVMTDRPLLLFRRGGASHRVDLHDSMPQFLRQVGLFVLRLNRAVAGVDENIIWKVRIRLVLWRRVVRFLLCPPLWRMFLHHLIGAVPVASRVHAAWSLRFNPAFRLLRRRVRTLSPGSRVVLFGAGKHTRRCFDVMESALRGRAIIAGICDDAADRHDAVGDVSITPADELETLSPDLVLVSSDTYEPTLVRRARKVTPPAVPVWCIYDQSLERLAHQAPPPAPTARSRSSTESIKAAI
ncbi:MAG: glycosyltransferase family 2 protein [Phycisphaerales bacterium]|nr:MAG: glycosyltransferase family 2 protein [Phycisphaerales bacterium]